MSSKKKMCKLNTAKMSNMTSVANTLQYDYQITFDVHFHTLMILFARHKCLVRGRAQHEARMTRQEYSL